jgi:hypothetical protein
MVVEERTAFCMHCRAVRCVKRDIPAGPSRKSSWLWERVWYGELATLKFKLFGTPPLYPWICTVCRKIVPLGLSWRVLRKSRPTARRHP